MAYRKLRQRILSVAFTHLPTDRIARLKWGKSWTLSARPDSPPIAITDTEKNAVRIVAHEAHAARLGIFNRQSLSDARALVPDLECHARDRDADHELLGSLAAWCERYTPLVALDGDDSLFMDVTGCTHLFGGEESFIADIETRLAAQGFSVRTCLADTAGAAWAMARHGTGRIIARDQHAQAISALPLAALRLDTNLVTSLGRVGFKTVGCIADLPRAPLAARFGTHLLDRLDQASGRQDEIISPLMPVAELAAEKRFADPIVHEDDIKRGIALLAGNIIALLERRDLGVRTCEVKLFRVDGEVQSLSVHAANPLRDADRIAALFHERLARLHTDLDAGFGFDIMRLNILQADPFNGGQHDLVEHKDAGDSYAALIDRLGARLGTDRVLQFSFADTHIPERRFALVPISGRDGKTDPDQVQLPGPARTPTRPLILLERPEPIDAIAQVPDSPPSRFRWRKVLYEIARSEGPERIACEWWRDGRASLSRDYFSVEDTQGYRFWLFRHGLYERETTRPDWYMHGLFS
ncbi:MAG: DNA polymerase Y family protein [Pseudomonadota bacterium]